MTTRKSRKKGTGGGAATGAGVRFQARMAAWLSVHILAEDNAETPWELTSSLRNVSCETSAAVDDIFAGTAEGGRIYLQAKRKLTLSPRPTSPLGSGLEQCVRGYLNARAQGSASSLTPARDRPVLAGGPRSSDSVKNHLASVVLRAGRSAAASPLSASAVNKEERAALRVLLGHVQREWMAIAGAAPTDDEIREFLAVLRIAALAVEDDQAEELRAKDLLRANVLADPTQADAAWKVLVEHCGGMIASRSSADRRMLERVLGRSKIQIQGVRSYRADLERLRSHSARVVERLADYAGLVLGTDRVQLDRPYVGALRTAAETGPVLVVGEPGVGKSGVMHGLAESLTTDGRDILVFATQDPPFTSLGGLRTELRLDHDVVDVLENWPGTEPAFLLIDALDAARTDASAHAMRQLIQEVTARAPRWRVVASIREFDLRNSREFRRLFAGDPPPTPGPRLPGSDFARVRHLVIGRLTDLELAQLGAKSPRLHELVETAPSVLAVLFTNVFNLRLAAELLDSGTAPEAIRLVRTQIELLDLYWEERVRGEGEAREADAREAVLRRAARGMVQDRSLQLDRDRVAEDPSASSALADMLSAHVLTEWAAGPNRVPDRSTLAFSHHVLFDYAVERLLLRVNAERFAAFLVEDPPLVLLVRPSVLLHFHYLWERDGAGLEHPSFWDATLAVCGKSEVPQIGKLVGPLVAGQEGRSLAEFERLADALTSSEERVREAAENAFDHLIRSLLAAENGAAALGGADAGPWCALIERVSRNFTRATAYPVRTFLGSALESPSASTPEQFADLATAARRLLEHAWNTVPRDRFLVIQAIGFVGTTFGADPGASSALLRRALVPEHFSVYGSDELPWLAEVVERIVAYDPDLVRDVYLAAYTYRETSEEPTPMGTIILPMVSNRRQDYNMALYRLGKAFPAFLRGAPEQAVPAMNAALEQYATGRRPGESEPPEVRFELCGKEVRFLPDYSFIWDRGGAHPDEEGLKLLDEFASYLQELAGREEAGEELQRVLDIALRQCRLGTFWRRLLRVGAQEPGTLGLEIRELAWTPDIVTGADTSVMAGDFIRAVAPLLGAAEREKIERTILAIPMEAPPGRLEAGERIRSRLLGCLGEADLVTEEARELLADLRAREAVPLNEDLVRFSWSSSPYSETDYLAERGVPVEEEPNRRIRDIKAAVEEFASRLFNVAPTVAEVNEALPHLRKLREALHTAETDGVHPEQADYAWGTLTSACAKAATAAKLSCSEDPGAFLRSVLIEASTHRLPVPDLEQTTQFDKYPGQFSLGGGMPRVAAAEGLMALAWDASCADEEVLAAVLRLSRDLAPEVRFQIVAHAGGLYRTAPEHFWGIVERSAAGEESRNMLVALLHCPLLGLRFEHPQRIASLAAQIYTRVVDGHGADEVRNACTDIFFSLYLWKNHALSKEIVLAIGDDVPGHVQQAAHLATQCRDVLVLGSPQSPNPEEDAARVRGIDFLTRVVRSAARALSDALAARAGDAASEARARLSEDELKSIAHLLDNAGMNLYIVSGAYDNDEEKAPSAEVQARLLRETRPIIDELADVGLASLTHHLLETLEVLVPYDPRGVLMHIARAVRGGRGGNYQYDSMAQRVLVRVMEGFLADHLPVFQRDVDAQRALVEILDTFISAGSAGARRLSYGLDAIFR